MRVAPLEVERERGEGDRLGWPGTASRGIGGRSWSGFVFVCSACLRIAAVLSPVVDGSTPVTALRSRLLVCWIVCWLVFLVLLSLAVLFLQFFVVIPSRAARIAASVGQNGDAAHPEGFGRADGSYARRKEASGAHGSGAALSFGFALCERA